MRLWVFTPVRDPDGRVRLRWLWPLPPPGPPWVDLPWPGSRYMTLREELADAGWPASRYRIVQMPGAQVIIT